MRLIINLPAYNEAAKIESTIKSIPRTFDTVTEVLIQVIDDGSSDDTRARARKAGADIIISHGSNRGLGKMFQTMRTSALENGADILVNIDADGQFNPNDIEKIIEPIIAGRADMVLADRFAHHEAKNIPYLKDRLNRLGACFVRCALGYPVTDLTCGFRAHNRETLLRLGDPLGFTYTQETIIDAIGKGLRLEWVPVQVTYFTKRKSRVVKTIWSYVNNSTRIIIRAVRDIRPMKFFGLPGLICIFFSAIFFTIFLFKYFPEMQVTPHRNSLIATATFFLIGFQFIVLALVADMIKNSRKTTEETLYHLRKQRYEKREKQN